MHMTSKIGHYTNLCLRYLMLHKSVPLPLFTHSSQAPYVYQETVSSLVLGELIVPKVQYMCTPTLPLVSYHT